MIGTSADEKKTSICTLVPRPRWAALLTAAIAAAVFVAIASLFVFHGRPNADEGFYAVISHEVMQGKLLYRDLAYTQTPLLPYIQGLVMSVIGFGVAQQRWLNVAVQAISLALAVYCWMRRRLSLPLVVGLGITWCLCLPLLYFGSIGKTYAMAQLFLVIASLCVIGTFRAVPALILLSLCGVLAVGCRLTVGPAVLILWIGFCRIHARNVSKTLLISTPLLFAIILLGPFIIGAPTNAYFWMWGFHMQVMTPRAPVAILMQLPLFAPGITILVVLGLVAATFQYSRDRFPGLCVMLAGTAGAIANAGIYGVYLEYAVPYLGLIIVGAGAVLVSCPLPQLWHYIGPFFCTLISISAFFLQDNNWTAANYLEDVATAGRYIAMQSKPEDQLLTSMPELGLASNRPLYPRSEMGKFAITVEMTPKTAFTRRIISFGELVYLTEQAVPKIIGLSRAERWNFRWSVPSMGILKKEYYNDFILALEKNYSCSFSNVNFLVYTRKPTSPLPPN
jgi:hypothetical protein